MSEYDFVSIDIRLTNLDGDNSYSAYKQTIPVSVLSYNDPQWLAKIIAIVNKLEVKNV